MRHDRELTGLWSDILSQLRGLVEDRCVVVGDVDDLVYFFFSSRRRHTRLQGDWSSDVCSSDLHYELPLSEIITDFFDQLKSRSRGYASLDYHFKEYRQSRLVKLDILIGGDPVGIRKGSGKGKV